MLSTIIRVLNTLGVTEHDKIKEERFWPHFKGAIGAIDGSHVPVSVPADDMVNHTNRHGYTSQNVLAICDFDMRFTLLLLVGRGLHMTLGFLTMHYQNLLIAFLMHLKVKLHDHNL